MRSDVGIRETGVAEGNWGRKVGRVKKVKKRDRRMENGVEGKGSGGGKVGSNRKKEEKEEE